MEEKRGEVGRQQTRNVSAKSWRIPKVNEAFNDRSAKQSPIELEWGGASGRRGRGYAVCAPRWSTSLAVAQRSLEHFRYAAFLANLKSNLSSAFVTHVSSGVRWGVRKGAKGV